MGEVAALGKKNVVIQGIQADAENIFLAAQNVALATSFNAQIVFAASNEAGAEQRVALAKQAFAGNTVFFAGVVGNAAAAQANELADLGAVGSLKALLGSPAALGGAQGVDGGVCGFETAALAAVAAAFALGGDGELFLVFALECEADDATLAVAPAAVFDAAFEFAFAAVDVADGYQLEAAALDVDPAGDAVVDIDGVLPGGGAGGKGAEKSGEEVFFHVGNFLVYGADCGRLAKVSA